MASLLSLMASIAWADGAFPDSVGILLPADAPNRVVSVTNFGLLVSDDQIHWNLVCEAAVGTSAFLYQHGASPPSDYAATLDGISSSRDGQCTWSIAPGAALRGATDLFVDPTNAAHVLAIARSGLDGGTVPMALFESRDGAQTFPGQPFVASPSAFLSGVEIAKSNPSVVYLSMIDFSPLPHLFLLRSDDGGGSWSTFDISSTTKGTDLRIAAVDPADPMKVYLRVISSSSKDQLAISEDGGQTVRLALSLPGPMSAFLRRQNGDLMVGTSLGKGFVSKDGGKTFAAWATPHLKALGERGGTLFAATNDSIDGFSIARSDDQGASWLPLMDLHHLCGIAACGQLPALCLSAWSSLRSNLGIASDACDHLPQRTLWRAPKGCGGCQSTGAFLPWGLGLLIGLLPGRRGFLVLLGVALATGAVAKGPSAEQEIEPATEEEPHPEDAPWTLSRMMEDALGANRAKESSGTSWQPEATPMFGHHLMAHGWMLMIHYNAFAGFDDQLGARGDQSAFGISSAMAMADRPLFGGRLGLRGMFSADPLTVPPGGAPQLLQTGETYFGLPLHDHQHPHDFFMEFGATYQRRLANGLAFQLYAAPSGEPALGPPAFMHRQSSMGDPLPPLGHHWQDSTHVSFGVVTAGLFTQSVKLEASWFNGREPDENRWDFDFGTFDSYSARLSVTPSRHWAAQVSYGFLKSPEALYPLNSVRRLTASAMGAGSLGHEGSWATTFVFGRNIGTLEPPTHSLLLEASVDPTGQDTFFTRIERINKFGHDLVFPYDPELYFSPVPIWSWVLGYVHDVPTSAGLVVGIGGRVSVGWIPSEIVPYYGSQMPLGFLVYLRLRPPRMIHP